MAWHMLLACVRRHPRPVTARELLEHPADMLVRGLYAPIVRRWSTPHFPLGRQVSARPRSRRRARAEAGVQLLVMQSSELFQRPVASMEKVSRALSLVVAAFGSDRLHFFFFSFFVAVRLADKRSRDSSI